jgi:hypothetical protein
MLKISSTLPTSETRDRYTAGQISWAKHSYSVIRAASQPLMGMTATTRCSRRPIVRLPLFSHSRHSLLLHRQRTQLSTSPRPSYTFFNIHGEVVSKNVVINRQKYTMDFVLDSNSNLLHPTTEMMKYGAQAEVVQFDNRDFWSSATKIAKDLFKRLNCDECWPRI